MDWAAAQVDSLTGSPGAPVVVLGESAGGNLAAAAALRRADVVGAQILCSPVMDHTMDYPSYSVEANQLTLTRDTMDYFWNQYVPEVARRAEPDASPTSLAGAPPAMVVLAEYDILRDEGQAYADRLAVAGVPVTTRVIEGQMHGFLANVKLLPAALSTVEDIADFLNANAFLARD